jgi:hypothetical protein
MRLASTAFIAVFMGAAIVAAQGAVDRPTLADPCTLVSRADIEIMIGQLKGNPRSGRNEPARVCEYAIAGGSDYLEIYLYPSSNLDRFRKDLEAVTPVAGIGQDAFVYHNKRFEQVHLLARKGGVLLQVILTDSKSAEETVKTIARKAIERI